MKKIISMFVMLLVFATAASAYDVDLSRVTGVCEVTGPLYGGDHGDWGVAPEGSTGYGDEGRDHFCMIVGPGDCSDVDTWSMVFTADGPVNKIRVRHLDGQVDDTFSMAMTDAAGGPVEIGMVNAPAGGGEIWRVSEWMNLPFTIPDGETRTLYFTAEAPIEPWCETWGQIAIDYVEFDYEEEVPEFGLLAITIAMIGALGGLFMLRKRR
ncbi:MAG: hypothetical protein KKG59_05335 [Nanoarchaeota archaeon]|nr:hypothetical protein [Nanoarchaeota archaeon]